MFSTCTIQRKRWPNIPLEKREHAARYIRIQIESSRPSRPAAAQPIDHRRGRYTHADTIGRVRRNSTMEESR